MPGRAGTILYALGWTHHSVGAQMIRTGAMVQLLLGNIGIAGGGMNALRGHSNIQGLTDLGLMSNLLPGYMTLPMEAEQDYEAFITKRATQPLRPNQLSYWKNYRAFHVSFMKSWWGDNATAENNFGFDYLPKLDKSYDLLQVFELMAQGKMNGYIAQGFNPLAAAPNKAKIGLGLSKLKWLVIMDPLATETSEFWKNFGEFNDVDSSKIQTEVFRLPTTCFAEERGSLVSSSRVLQWHWQGAQAPYEARSDLEIMSGLWLRIRQAYKEKGGKYPDPILKMSWPYADPESPTPEEIAMEFNGRALADVTDAADKTKVSRRRASNWRASRNCATTARRRRAAGSSAERGRRPATRWAGATTPIRRASARRSDWAWAWPANRRILYNRASCDVSGKPFDPTRKLIAWNGRAWTGADIPDFKADEPPENGMNPFIMNPEGVARFFARDGMNEGPFPAHYEPFENPLGYNPLYPDNKQAVSNPAARVFPDDRAAFGTAKDFPHTATTYRLTEHFHYWTKHARLNAIVQPQQFVEIGEDLAKEVGVVAGDRVRVSSNRGHIVAVAVVTKRIKPLMIEGRKVQTVGLPLHWGFKGLTKPGYLVNTLTPSVGDGNSQTPEFKSFLVKVEKA